MCVFEFLHFGFDLGLALSETLGGFRGQVDVETFRWFDGF